MFADWLSHINTHSDTLIVTTEAYLTYKGIRRVEVRTICT